MDDAAGRASGGGGARAVDAGGLPLVRRRLGAVLVLLGLPALTAALVAGRGGLTLASVLLLYLMAVVVIAVVGGLVPAVCAAAASFLLANWFLTPPFHTLSIESRDSAVALAVYAAVAVLVAVTVDLAARARVGAERSRLEARLLSQFTAAPVGASSVADVLEQVRRTFAMTSVALREVRTQRTLAEVGPPFEGAPTLSLPASAETLLVAAGPELLGEDTRLLRLLATTAARAWEAQGLADEAARARELAEVDRVRSALLAAVGHDLRTPLAGIKTAVSSLRLTDVAWSRADEDALLATIEEGADRLGDLIANLLAMSRLQAGALSLAVAPVALDEVVGRALIDQRGVVGVPIEVAVPDDLPLVLADPGLLERVVANLVSNARRFSPAGRPVEIHAGRGAGDGAVVRLSVVDHGPGVPHEQWQAIFAPFQRFDDGSRSGLGLGLAIARGFTVAMGGTLAPGDTPGGGLTMTVCLPTAADGGAP